MPYIGNTAADRFVASKAASVYSGDGSTTAFTLEHSVGSDEDILVSVDGVIQEPSVAYAVSSGTTLTFTAAPSTNSGNNIFVYYLFKTVGTIDHPATSALTATSGTFSTDLTVDTTTLVTDSTNNRVGVGTASPTTQLDVTSSGNGEIAIISGTSGITALYMGDSAQKDKGKIFYHNGSDYMAFNANGAEQMKIDSTGAVTKPNQPAFLARPASQQANIAVGTEVTVAFGTEVFDQNADFASNTFTAPVTGKYFLSCQLYIKNIDSASSYYETQLITSNRIHYTIVDPDFGQDAAYWNLSISVLTDMDAGDTAIVKLVQGAGTAQTDVETVSQFSGYLVA